MKRRWRKLGKGRNNRTDIELVVRAVNVVVNNDRGNHNSRHVLKGEEAEAEFRRFWCRYPDMLGRNRLLAMFCPQVRIRIGVIFPDSFRKLGYWFRYLIRIRVRILFSEL